MAKAATAKETTANLPAAAKNTQLSAEVMAELEASAGEGVSSAAEDNIVPLVYVLQDNSPAAKKRDPAYVEGAEPGDLLLKSANMVFKGDEGFEFQPCAFSKAVVEWIPRAQGGGFVGQHAEMPGDMIEVPHPENPKKKRRVSSESQHEYVDTRYHAGQIIIRDEAGNITDAIPAVITLSSTGHTFSRQWMAMMNRNRLPNGKPLASRAHTYRITTVGKSNVDGSWFGLKAEDLGPVNDIGLLRSGKALHDAFMGGTVTAERPDDMGSGAEDGAIDEAESAV